MPEKAYAALVDPVALTAWLPPKGMTGRIERFDLRPGGSFRMVLTYDDSSTSQGKSAADSDIAEARFTEIVPGVRVVYEVQFVSDDPAYARPMTITWEVTPLFGASRVDITADNVPDGISAEDHAEGLTASLTNLAQYLSQ
jgi:uncharacterized protein YndB with AHSA1/START domain